VTVYLVGAGPGDPGLLTRRGEELLRRADVVVYDRLASPSLLAFAPSAAELVDVGKAPGRAAMSQAEINKLLVTRGAAGQEVVRLKGGDPFVFGRGGEEAEECIAAGVPFEVVPGVTSAIAAPAYAGIPVTHRGVSTSVTIVTGHEDPAKGTTDTDWHALAKIGGTLVILMGAGRIADIADALVKGGLAPDTPVAAVRWGTRPEQTSVRATLATIAGHALVVNADLPAATPAALGRLAASELALVEAADGTTNALSLPDPRVFAPLYGPGSAARFRSHAPFATVAILELAFDVDVDDDLERIAARAGPRTRALLAVPA
jgi:uroporphyrinogen III methyltransferase/synthase